MNKILTPNLNIPELQDLIKDDTDSQRPSTKYTTVKFTDKGLDFFGTQNTSKIDGIGLLQLKTTQEEYRGEFKRSKMAGFGIFKFENGVVYKGSFLENKLNGLGKLTFPNRSTLTAIFRDNKIKGFAVIKNFTRENEVSYIKGYIHNGLLNGWSSLTDEKSNFEGEMVNGCKNGLGIFKSNSVFYKGFWKNDKKSGFGDLKATAYMYSGGFFEGKRHGVGKLRSNDPKNFFEYFGNFSKGKKNGFGKFVQRDSVYIGGWNGDRRHGLGYFKDSSSGDAYFGYWKNDKKDGLGIAYGDLVVTKGEFCRGRVHGRAIMKLRRTKEKKLFRYFYGEIDEEIDRKVEEEMARFRRRFRNLKTGPFFAKAEEKIKDMRAELQESSKELKEEWFKLDKDIERMSLNLNKGYKKIEGHLEGKILPKLEGILEDGKVDRIVPMMDFEQAIEVDVGFDGDRKSYLSHSDVSNESSVLEDGNDRINMDHMSLGDQDFFSSMSNFEGVDATEVGFSQVSSKERPRGDRNGDQSNSKDEIEPKKELRKSLRSRLPQKYKGFVVEKPEAFVGKNDGESESGSEEIIYVEETLESELEEVEEQDGDSGSEERTESGEGEDEYVYEEVEIEVEEEPEETEDGPSTKDIEIYQSQILEAEEGAESSSQEEEMETATEGEEFTEGEEMETATEGEGEVEYIEVTASEDSGY